MHLFVLKHAHKLKDLLPSRLKLIEFLDLLGSSSSGFSTTESSLICSGYINVLQATLTSFPTSERNGLPTL